MPLVSSAVTSFFFGARVQMLLGVKGCPLQSVMTHMFGADFVSKRQSQ